MGRRLPFNRVPQLLSSLMIRPQSEYELTPLAPLALKAHGEQPKVAIEKARCASAWRGLIHIAPILITAAIVSLSFSTVYWTDLGHSNINSLLNAFQFAAKFHEILIGASLSAIVLHRIRYELIEDKGLALGYLTSGYQLTSLSYLASKEFWGGVTARKRYQAAWSLSSLLPIWLLITIAIALAAVSGPSSAIVMIPRLDWWEIDNPLNGSSFSTFIPLNHAEIWPNKISKENLANQPEVSASRKSCLRDDAWQDRVCPSAGATDIESWTNDYMNQKTEPNITLLDDNSGSARYLSSSYLDRTIGWSSTSIVGSRQARDLSIFWQFLTTTNLEVTKSGRPTFHPSLSGGAKIMKPIVEAQCALFSNDSKDIAFPHDQLVGLKDTADGKPWFLPPHRFDLGSPANGIVSFNWTNLTQYTDKPALGAVFVSTTHEGTTGVFPCTILSYWTPVKIWFDPKIDSVILQDSPVPLKIMQANNSTSPKKHQSPLEPIDIDISWANALNLPNKASAYNNLNLTIIEASAVNLGYTHTDRSWRFEPAGWDALLPWLLSTVLSMHVADGLSRVNSGFSTVVWEKDYNNASNGHLQNIDDRYLGDAWAGAPARNNQYLYAQTARTSNASHNTELVWEVQRFGYGWGFGNGVTLLLACVVLFIHAGVAIAHLAIVTFGNWGMSTSWSSMGEMIALAARSRQPQSEEGQAEVEALENTSAGIETVGTWREIVRIRDREVDGGRSRLELLFDTDRDIKVGWDDGSAYKVVTGKKYS